MLADDLSHATEAAISELNPLRDVDWSLRAFDMTWSCRRTLDHIVDTLLLYASSVARQAAGPEQWTPLREQNPEATIPVLLDNLKAASAILDQVCRAAPDGARAFHPSGRSDVSGFRAMGCSEILTHTDDILLGLGRNWSAPPDPGLCQRILERVLPWAPDATEEPDRWQALRWACGRIALPTRSRLDDQWWWHAAPIAEWDGERQARTTPPAWS